MSGRNLPVVLFPRYTTFLGGGLPWLTAPIPVEASASVYVDFWHGQLLVAPTIAVVFLESNDGTAWSNCTPSGSWSVPPSPGETSLAAFITKSWFQFGVLFGGGATAGVTCWAEGFFELREH